MSSLNLILKPKSAEDIKSSLSKLYDINIESPDISKILDINYMTNIIDINRVDGGVFYCSEILEIPASIINDFNSVVFTYTSYKISFSNQKKMRWGEIHNKFVNRALKISDKSIGKINGKEYREIMNAILNASNLIIANSRTGAGNFIIVPKDFKFISHLKQNILFKTIISNQLKKKIIVGRKGRLIDPGLKIFKHNEKIMLKKIGELAEKYYICIDYE